MIIEEKEIKKKKKEVVKVEPKPEKLPNQIDEYLKEQETNSKLKSSRELFLAEKEDIDLKTDLDINDVHNINVLMVNDSVLLANKLEPVFSMFYNEYMRLKISLDRKSRGEFVSINAEEKTGELLDKASNLSAIVGSRK